MKTRVDNFLKVARTKLMELSINQDSWEINELYEQLLKILDGDTDLCRELKDGWNAILQEKRVLMWDEKFLNVIAGDEQESREEKLNKLNRQLSQGVGKQRIGQGSVAVSNGGTGVSNAVWTNHAVLEKELQELKDEIRANRWAEKA